MHDISRAHVIIEALPYIQKFHKQDIVIKLGGNAMVDAALLHAFSRDLVLLKLVGIRPIVVHGGGPQIDKVLKQCGIVARYVNGLRYTDSATMDIVQMVLGGLVNKQIVDAIHHVAGQAVGLTGKDGKLILAKKITAPDIGWVGEVADVNVAVLQQISNSAYIPIIAPIANDAAGNTLNINADLVASGIATHMQAKKLIFLTNVAGVLDATGQRISKIACGDIDAMIADGVIHGGMIPKIHCARAAISHGVEQVHILDGRNEHSILLELFTNQGVGTLIQ